MSRLITESDLGFVAQLHRFDGSIGTYAMVLGISSTQLNSISNDADYMSFVVLGAGKSKEYAEAWTSRKNRARKGTDLALGSYPTPVDIITPPVDVVPGIENRFSMLVATIKAHPAYNNDMGEDLGIIAADASAPATTTVLTLKRDAQTIVIGFKKGDGAGVRLYSKRGSETAFTFLALDTRSPYVDNRPNLVQGVPEKREYYAYLYDASDDSEYGDQSAVVSITI